MLRRHSKTNMKGRRSKRLQLFHSVFHLPSLQFQHQKSRSPCNHGDDSPAARCFVPHVTVGLLCLAPELMCVCSCLDCQCLRMPASSASTLRSNRHLPAPVLYLHAIVPRWLLMGGTDRCRVQNCNNTVEWKEESSLKRERNSTKGLSFYRYSLIYRWRCT